MTNPQPRPALRKAPDRSIHPAAPRLTPIVATLPHPPAAIENPSGKNRKGKRDRPKHEPKASRDEAADPRTVDDRTVELVVPIPKSLRKRVRAKAAEHGMSAEEAAYQLLRAWAGE